MERPNLESFGDVGTGNPYENSPSFVLRDESDDVQTQM